MKICERIEARRSPARRLPWRARMGRAAVASCASMLLWFSAAASAQDGPEAERPEEPAAETAPAETAPAETAPAEGAGEVEAATEGEATVPEVAPVPKPPVRPPVLPCPPAGAPQYHMVFRPAVWIPISRTVFRKGVGGTVFSLEDDKHPFLDARGIHLLFPVEAMFRSDSKEFKIRYVHWENYTTNGLSGGPPLLNFGGVDFSGRVSARLQTDVLGLDFHQNLWNSPSMGLYLMAGGDLFSTNLELSGSAGSKSLREALPILTVGLGLRFKVKRTADVTMSSSALSYSQLLGMRERFFGADDVYRNAEISVEWEFRPRLHLGAGWKHYEVSFQDEAAKASQEYRGLVFWALCRF